MVSWKPLKSWGFIEIKTYNFNEVELDETTKYLFKKTIDREREKEKKKHLHETGSYCIALHFVMYTHYNFFFHLHLCSSTDAHIDKFVMINEIQHIHGKKTHSHTVQRASEHRKNKKKNKIYNEESLWKIVKLLPYGQKINDAIS